VAGLASSSDLGSHHESCHTPLNGLKVWHKRINGAAALLMLVAMVLLAVWKVNEGRPFAVSSLHGVLGVVSLAVCGLQLFFSFFFRPPPPQPAQPTPGKRYGALPALAARHAPGSLKRVPSGWCV
jgi:hypothetical protein